MRRPTPDILGIIHLRDGPRFMREKLDKVYEAQHGDVEDWSFKMFCVPNAWRTFLTGTASVPLKPYACERRRGGIRSSADSDGMDSMHRFSGIRP